MHGLMIGSEANRRNLCLTFCGRAPDMLIWQEAKVPDSQGLTSSVSLEAWDGEGRL